MFGFLKGKKKGLEELLTQASVLEKELSLSTLAHTYYEIGKLYQEKDDLERAKLYLERANTLYSNFDEVYDKCQSFMEDCDERLGALEEEDILYNSLLEQVEEKASEFSNEEKFYWGLLSLARLESTLKRLAVCPGCEILLETEKVLTLWIQSMHQDMQEADREYLNDFLGRFYEFGDSEAFVDVSNQVPLSDGTVLQFFDLNGNDTMTCLHLFIDTCFSALSAGADWVEVGDDAEVDFIACTILGDYYLRTQDGNLRDNPKVQEELARIWSDAEFVDNEPEIDEVIERIQAYRKLDLLA